MSGSCVVVNSNTGVVDIGGRSVSVGRKTSVDGSGSRAEDAAENVSVGIGGD